METKKHKVQFFLKGKLGPDIDALVKSFREILVQPVDAEDQVITGEFAHSYSLEMSNSKNKLGQKKALSGHAPHLLQATTQNVFSVPAATNMALLDSAEAEGLTENRHSELSIADIRAQILGSGEQQFGESSQDGDISEEESKLFGIGENTTGKIWYNAAMTKFSDSSEEIKGNETLSPLHGGRFDPDNPFAITSPSFHHSAAKAVMTTVQITSATVVNISITSIGSREKLIPKIINSPAAEGGLVSILNPVISCEDNVTESQKTNKISSEPTSIMSKLKRDKSPSQNTSEDDDGEIDHLDISVTIEDDQFVMVDKEKRWRCKLCPKSYTTKHNLVTHILDHSDIRPHLCLLCKKYFKQLNHLNVHMLTHDQVKPHICSICNKAFTQISHLQRHQNTHEGSKSYTCDICEESFVYKVELIAHRELHDEPEKCAHCEQVFDTAEALQEHMITENHVTGITCKVCDKVFRLPSQMLNHLKSHFNGRPFTCKTCGLDFAKEKHLKFHELTHVGPKPYPCPQCGRLFNQKANMQRHLLIHNDQRAFKCERCGKTFSQPQTLKAHMIVHADSKPYKCEICGKQFGRLHNLQGHMHTHSESKPFSCSICQSTFTLKGNLNRHKKVKHGLDESTEVMEENAVNFLSTLSGMRENAVNSNSMLDTDSRDSFSSPESRSSRKGRKSVPRKHVARQHNSEDESDQEDEHSDDDQGNTNERSQYFQSHNKESSRSQNKRKQITLNKTERNEENVGNASSLEILEKTENHEFSESRSGRKRRKINFGKDFIG